MILFLRPIVHTNPLWGFFFFGLDLGPLFLFFLFPICWVLSLMKFNRVSFSVVHISPFWDIRQIKIFAFFLSAR